MPSTVKFDPTKDDATHASSQISRKVAEMIAPKLEDKLIEVANEKIWSHPQIKDNNIPSTSLAATVVYDIDTSGDIKLLLNILNDEIDGTKDIEVGEYTRHQVTKDPREVALVRSTTGRFEPKGEGKVSSHTRSLVNKRHFQLSNGSWITSSTVPAEIITEVIEETLKEILGGGST